MNKDKMRALLAEKVDSLERWRAICDECDACWDPREWDIPDGHSFHYGETVRYCNARSAMEPKQYWWLAREAARLHVGVYTSLSTVLQHVTQNAGLSLYCIHISRKDPTMVAYTPTFEDGLRDRQVMLSVGKLLRKLLFLATDDHIQKLEAAHRSEMDPTFLVARTTEEIQRVYTTMAGDSGCMRYAPDQWGLPPELHPSHAYAYAGLGVAYTEVDGRVMSRSVIYDNPDNPKDKRYVRIYGDPSLKRKLELAGYRCDNLQGAKLRAIHLHDANPRTWGRNQYLVPYLDGAAGEQNQRGGSFGYIIKGEDCIRLIDNNQAARLNSLVGNAVTPQFKSTSAVHSVPVVEPELLTFTCAVTGRQCNTLETEAVHVLHEGEVKRAAASAELTHLFPFHVLHYLDGAATRRVRLRVTADDLSTSFMHGSSSVYDTPANRLALGYVQLHEAHYGAGMWVQRTEAVESVAGNGKWYLRSDCAVVFDAQGNETYQIAPVVEQLKKSKDYVSLAPKGTTKALSHKDNPRLVMTMGKRRCVRDWHAVVQLFDGQWDYAQNVRQMRMFYLRFSVSDKQSVNSIWDVRLTQERVDEMEADTLRDIEDCIAPANRVQALRDTAEERLRYGVEGTHFFMKGEMVMRGSSWAGEARLDSMRRAIAKVNASTDEQIAEILDASYVRQARCWAHNAALLLDTYDRAIARYQPAPTPAPADDLDTQLAVAAAQIAERIREQTTAAIA